MPALSLLPAVAQTHLSSLAGSQAAEPRSILAAGWTSGQRPDTLAGPFAGWSRLKGRRQRQQSGDGSPAPHRKP